MNRLACQFLGLDFKNPIIAASGTFGNGFEYNEIYDVSILGGISLKGLSFNAMSGNSAPRIVEVKAGIINSVGLQNPGFQYYMDNYDKKIQKFDTIKIANLAGHSFDEYRDICEAMNKSSVDLFELNISCPNVDNGGMAFGTDSENVYKITKIAKEVANKKLIVKLSPNVTRIQDMAKAAEEAGADAISLINTVEAMAIDYRKRKTILSRIKGGLSGPCIKPIALRMVWDVYNTVKIPIIGIGGIETYTDVIEFMLCGASLVQVGSANLYNPYVCKNIIEDLQKYTEEENIMIRDLVGKLEV